MNYVLFIGGKVGLEALALMIELKCKLMQVFIEPEHDHEYIKVYKKAVEVCKQESIDFCVDSSRREIMELLSGKIGNGASIDYILSFGYRKIIPANLLSMAKRAALGTHFSPLPRYRGFAPLNWMLINGETETAVNLFYLDEEVDSGDIVDVESVSIHYDDDINGLLEKCMIAFREMMSRAIPRLEKGHFDAVKQNEAKATYTCARNPDDGLIDWQLPAHRIYNLVRALTYPYPGAYSYLGGERTIIWSCEEYEIAQYEGLVPGKVIKIVEGTGVVVLCGEGAVLLKDVQVEGEGRQRADKRIKSVRLTIGAARFIK